MKAHEALPDLNCVACSFVRISYLNHKIPKQFKLSMRKKYPGQLLRDIFFSINRFNLMQAEIFSVRFTIVPHNSVKI